MRFPSSFRPALAGALLAVAASCSRTDPHTLPLDATSPRRLASWCENVVDRFKRDEWREFEASLQEVRLRVMGDRAASGSAAVEEAMCGRVNGRTFSEVIVMGWEAKLARLDPVREELKRAVDTNAMLVTKPGDASSARYLDGLRERQEERVRKVDVEIEEAERRLVELQGATWSAKVAERQRARSGPVAAPALTREQARAELTNFIREQRDAALLKLGAWPAKIVRETALLPEPERAGFEARRAEAAGNGHTVIAVHLRDRWWIYDERAALPGFSRAVMANLADTDQREISELWANWQAELWARRRAQEELSEASLR